MSDPRTHIEAQLEAQRFIASQAARETSTLDPRTVLYAIQALINSGRIEEARAMAAAFKAGRL
jgi:hypothetical protein